MRVKKLKQPSLNLPFLLVLGMGACVLFTGLVSYKLGDAALEGVTQPENSPTQKLISQPSEAADNQPTIKFTPVNIAQIAKKTRIYIQNQQKRKDPEEQADTKTTPQTTDKTPEANPEKKP